MTNLENRYGFNFHNVTAMNNCRSLPIVLFSVLLGLPTLVCSSLGHPKAGPMSDPAGYSLPGRAG